MTAVLGVEMTELTRVQAEFHQRCGALAHVAALALQARGRPCDVTALRKLLEADAMALAAAGPLLSEALTDLEAAVAKWITAGCVSVVHRTWAAAPPSGVADPASVHAIELRFNEPGNWVGALVSCTGGLTILEWPAATAPAATAAVTRGAEVFTRARQESPRFLDAMREAWAAVPGGRAPNESMRERAAIGVDDIVRQEAAQSPVTKAKIEAWYAEVWQRKPPTWADARAERQVHVVHPRAMEALQAECASGKHTYDLFEARCMVCGIELMMEVDLAACEDKYLGEPGTVRYVAHDEASPRGLVIDYGPLGQAAGRAADKMREAFERAQPAMQTLASRVSAAAAKLDFLHPTGRCTCFGEGRCEWCEFDRRRERREYRQALRAATKRTMPPGEAESTSTTEAVLAEQARKRCRHERKQARRRRRGY